MKLLSLFTGIGAFEKALKNIGIDYELVGFSEIDKYAIKSYCAIHNEREEKNLGDITKIDITKLPKDIDIITHGSPCQDFSIAGKQAGGDLGTGTRSSLMWNTINIVTYCKPKYVIWENVKNLLSKKHRHNFDSYLSIMESLGYNNYYQVLNAKDYGIPQNRERVYTISIRKDIDKSNFKFPEKEELKLRLKDMLENEVDKKYYLSDEITNKYIPNKSNNTNVIGNLVMKKWQDNMKRIYDIEKYSPAINTMQGGNLEPKIMIKNGTKKGYIEAEKGVSQTLQYKDMMGVINAEMKIRKLTPKECWRLMGFSDNDFEKVANVPTSNTQLYKQARKFNCCKCFRKNIFKFI